MMFMPPSRMVRWGYLGSQPKKDRRKRRFPNWGDEKGQGWQNDRMTANGSLSEVAEGLGLKVLLWCRQIDGKWTSHGLLNGPKVPYNLGEISPFVGLSILLGPWRPMSTFVIFLLVLMIWQTLFSIWIFQIWDWSKYRNIGLNRKWKQPSEVNKK